LFIFELALVLDGKSGLSSTEPPIVFGNFGNEIDLLTGRDAKSERGFPVVVSYRQVTGTNYVHANENIASCNGTLGNPYPRKCDVVWEKKIN
jgi:hypothetical protein